MKKRVLIVEDDKFFRFAVKKVIDWGTYGFEIVGEAVHGAAALEFLEGQAVEVVITDMSMPVMNGIELTKALKEKYPDILIIALSAYDDFEFVKESMKLGAQDYILKQDIEKEDVGQTIQNAWEKHMENLAKGSHMRSRILACLETGDVDERAEVFLELYLGSQSGVYLCRIENLNESWQSRDLSEEGGQKKQWLMQSLMELQVKGEHILFLSVKENHSRKGQMEERDRLLRELELLLKDEDYLGGVSGQRSRIQDLHQMYMEAGWAKEYGRFSRKKGIRIWDYVKERGKERKEEFLKEKKSFDWICTLEDAITALNELTEDILKAMPSEENIQKNYLLLLNGAAENLHYEIGKLEFAELKERLGAVRLILSKHEVCLLFLEQLFGNRAADTMHPSVLQGIQYMRQNYKRDLSLGDISEYVALNETYFSGLFKKDTKKSIPEYLNQIRIEKAKELIAETNGKNYEIAEQVGIGNASYFSTIFKKQTGMTIQEYRQMLLRKKEIEGESEEFERNLKK